MLIKLDNISKYFGSRLLFENISFEISEGEKIGFIGENGIGKTTLLKIITGETSHDDGTVTKSNNLKIGYLSQQAPEDKNTTVFEEVLSAYSRLIELEQKIADITLDISLGDGDAEKLAELQHKYSAEFEQGGGFVYKSMARSTLLGLGFTEDDFSKKIPMLSGGEKTRVMLAKLLLSDCNLLLLDEPTNHLDIQSVEWLENFLNSYSGACLVISHDRYFLDKVTTKTFELFENKMYSFSGSYSTYQKKREEMFSAIQKKYDNTILEIERIEEIIKQQRSWNRERNIKTAESKQKAIDRLVKTLVAPPSEHDTISFELASAMESYQNKDYATALQKFDSMHQVDENYLIYKAICLLETDKTKDAISLLEELVGNGEGTEYYQQACWYLALAYLRNHEDEKAFDLLNLFNDKNSNIESLTNSLK